MKLGRCQLSNFGSYKAFDFDFSNQGLALVYGSTGAGKSTFLDAAAWCLYGITAKNGNSDEVISWQAEGETTRGEIEVRTPTGDIIVVRSRGTSRQNDLFWYESGPDPEQDASLDRSTKHRGKDLADTQKLLNLRLGVSAELFLAASYFHEFSETASFFTAAAKDRRALFERLSNLSLPIRIADASSSKRKDSKSELGSKKLGVERLAGQLEHCSRSLASTRKLEQVHAESLRGKLIEIEGKARNFETEKESKIQTAQTQAKAWQEKHDTETDSLIARIEEIGKKIRPVEEIKAKITAVKEGAKCPQCGGLTDVANSELETLYNSRGANDRLAAELKQTTNDLRRHAQAENPYQTQFEHATALQNTYFEQLEAERTRPNPHTSQIAALESDIATFTSRQAQLSVEVSELEARISSLSLLYDLSFALRAELLKKAVASIQDRTNKILEQHFEAELRVSFTADSDNLEVQIRKNGYEAVFRQLSKGQRQLLKLSFSVAVMEAAANTAGVYFDCLAFDEALDGMDADLKTRSYDLFQELAQNHGSVLVVEHHSEFQNLFAKRFHVTLDGDESIMESEES